MSVATITAAVACFAGTGGSGRLVTVQAPPRATVGVFSLWTRSGSCWRRIAGPWQARLGRSGLSAHEREGDCATPTCTYRFGATVYGIAPDPGVRLRYRLACYSRRFSSPRQNPLSRLRMDAGGFL
jgi:L,D-peptidoglycan transpeptidase YkuD (ErfK/YbiS/YcfS/YnhG family)